MTVASSLSPEQGPGGPLSPRESASSTESGDLEGLGAHAASEEPSGASESDRAGICKCRHARDWHGSEGCVACQANGLRNLWRHPFIERQPAEHCGHQPATLATHPTECVLRPGHSGSHADETGMRWWETASAPAPVPADLRERYAAALYSSYGQQDRDRSLRIADAVLAVRDTELEQMRAEIGRLRDEREDLRYNLAMRAFTAPDADFDGILSSLDARIRAALDPQEQP